MAVDCDNVGAVAKRFCASASVASGDIASVWWLQAFALLIIGIDMHVHRCLIRLHDCLADRQSEIVLLHARSCFVGMSISTVLGDSTVTWKPRTDMILIHACDVVLM